MPLLNIQITVSSITKCLGTRTICRNASDEKFTVYTFLQSNACIRCCGETACVEENETLISLRSCRSQLVGHVYIYSIDRSFSPIIMLTRSRKCILIFKYQNRIIRIVPHPNRKRGVPPLQLLCFLCWLAQQGSVDKLTIEMVNY